MEPQVATDFLASFSAACLVNEIIQKMKECKKVSFLGEGKSQANFLAGLAGAVISAEGVHLTVDPTMTMINLSVPVQVLTHAIWDVGKSWALQQFLWRLAIKPRKTTALEREPEKVEAKSAGSM